MICAVDVETSGLNPSYHQIMELAIIPVGDDWGEKLDDSLNLRLKVSIFDKKALAINGLSPVEGLTKNNGLDAFYSWKKRNGIDKIIALGHNVVFDLSFISNWLPTTDRSLSHLHFDTMQIALFLNSKYKIFKDGVGLQKVAKSLSIEVANAHSALDDALTALRCFRAMQKYIHNPFQSTGQ